MPIARDEKIDLGTYSRGLGIADPLVALSSPSHKGAQLASFRANRSELNPCSEIAAHDEKCRLTDYPGSKSGSLEKGTGGGDSAPVESLSTSIWTLKTGMHAVDRISRQLQKNFEISVVLDDLRLVLNELEAPNDILWIEALRGRSNSEALAIARTVSLRVTDIYGDFVDTLLADLNVGTATYLEQVDSFRIIKLLCDAADAVGNSIKWLGVRHEKAGQSLLLVLGKILRLVESTRLGVSFDDVRPVYKSVARAILYYVSDPYAQNLLQVGTTFGVIDRAVDDVEITRSVSHPGDLAFDPHTGCLEVVRAPRALVWECSSWRFISMAGFRQVAFDALCAEEAACGDRVLDISAFNRYKVVRDFVCGKNNGVWDGGSPDRRQLGRQSGPRPGALLVGFLNCVQFLRGCPASSFIASPIGKRCVVTDESSRGVRLQLARSINLLFRVGEIVILHDPIGGGFRAAMIQWFVRDDGDVATLGLSYLEGSAMFASVSSSEKHLVSQDAILVRSNQDDKSHASVMLIFRKGYAIQGNVNVRIHGITYSLRPKHFIEGESVAIVTYH